MSVSILKLVGLNIWVSGFIKFLDIYGDWYCFFFVVCEIWWYRLFFFICMFIIKKEKSLFWFFFLDMNLFESWRYWKW